MSRRGLVVAGLLVLPVVELVVLALMVDAIGAVPTVLIVVGGVVLGLAVVRSGARQLRRAASTSGRMAADRVTDPTTWTSPLLVVLAGLLLMIPGVVTDIVGLLLLVPGVRFLVLGAVGARLARRFPSASAAVTQVRIFGGGPVVPGTVVEGEATTGPTGPQDDEPQPPMLPR